MTPDEYESELSGSRLDNVGGPPRSAAQRRFGVTASVLSGSLLLLYFAVFVWSRFEENAGYGAFPLIIGAFYVGPAAALLALCGLLVAIFRRHAFLWPMIGLGLSVAYGSIPYLLALNQP